MNIILVEKRTDGLETQERSYQKSLIRIGRDTAECDIAFDGAVYPMVSRKHAELRWFESRWILVDLNSSFGTFVDGKRLTAPYKVHAGERLQFGADGPVMEVVWFEALIDSQPASPAASPAAPQPGSTPKPPPKAGGQQPESTPFSEPAKSTPMPANDKPRPSSARIEFSSEPGRTPYQLSGQGISLGREPACDIAFDASATMVSRVHAHIRQEQQDFVVADNKSFNGTFLNGNRISTPTPLYHNDEICLGVGGPRLRFDSPSRNAPLGASLAGQRSVQAGSAAAAFEAVDEVNSKTVFYNLDKPSATAQASAGTPQIMMSLTFGGKKALVIGRDKSNDIILDGLQISSRHARLVDNGSGIAVEDLNSTNGVYLNGKRISRSAITPNDSVQIGSFLIKIDAKQNVGVFDTRSKTRVDAIKITKEVGSMVGGSRIRLLDSISLSIQPNEFIGILGPSGSGKSTLIEAMNGMRPASSGNILVNNLDLYTHLDSLKQAIGYVPQDDIIHRELSVYRTLYYVARLRLSRDISRAEIDQTINEVMDVTGLSERRDVAVSRLSGGQRKRVSIAVELITKPSIIFLDEPTSGLDPAVEERIMKLFRQIAESGRTVILTTHAMENVRLFDKVIVLMRGKLVFFGKPEDALSHLGAQSFKALFDKLEEPINESVKIHGESARQKITEKTSEEWRQKFQQTALYKKNIDEPLRQLGTQTQGKSATRSRLGIFGSVRQWLVLSMRYLDVLFKDKLNLLILLAQAPIIAFLTYLVMGRNLPRDLVYFVLSLVSVWFGTSVSAREIIREHAIYRRERMVNLGILPYVGSKLAVLGFIVGIQCFLLFVPLKLLDLAGLMPMPGDFLGIPQFWAMLLTASVGIAIGLLISALVKTSELATSIVPLILIPQILFSGIFGVPTGINRVASIMVPTAWSFDTVKRYSTLDTLEPEGAKNNGWTAGQGLYRHIETENDKIIKKAREDVEAYQKTSQDKLRKYEDDLRSGFSPTLPRFDEPPAIPPAVKMPKDLSTYITFLHPWMNEIVNQLVLMIMFGVLVIMTLIVLRLRDVH